jgi:hypothetical protein
MKNINQDSLIRYIAGDLSDTEMKQIHLLIERDRAWSDAYQAMQNGLRNTEENLKAVSPDVQPPPYYWNSFNPRLNERIDQMHHRSKLLKRWSYITAPALGLAAMLMILFRVPDETVLKPAQDWLYSFYTEETIESMLNSKSLSAEDFLNSISLTDNEINGFDEYSISTSSESAESVYLEPVDEFQKLEQSQQDEILKELSKTEFL